MPHKILGVVVALLGTVVLVAILALAGLHGALTTIGGSLPSTVGRTDIPPDYLQLYQQAATDCPGLDWALLAAIGKTETNHGRDTAPGVTSGQNAAGRGRCSSSPPPSPAFSPTTDYHPAAPPRPRPTTRTTPSTPPPTFPIARWGARDVRGDLGRQDRVLVYRSCS